MSMNTKNGINNLGDIFKNQSFREEVEFETQMLALSFLSAIEKEVDIKKMNRNELAKKVGTSASYITQILRGNKTPNLKILTALGLALDKKFNIIAVDNIEQSRKKYEENPVGPSFDSKRIKKLQVCYRKPESNAKQCQVS